MLIKCLFGMLGLQRSLFLFDWKLAWHMGYVYIYVCVQCVCAYVCICVFLLNLFEAAVL